MSKEEIIKQLQLAEEEFTGFCRCIDADSFFRQPANRWSVAQNVKHLTISANTTKLAFVLPKFILLLYTGKPNRLSRNFNELTNKYKTKLQQGGKASGRYIPAIISPQVGKENILAAFSKSMNQLSDCVAKKWTNAQLDQYLARHPLLGKITLRELCYFTIYHTRHHLEIIKERLHDDIIST